MRVRVDHRDGHDIVDDTEIPAFLKRYPLLERQRLGHTGQPFDPWEPFYEARTR